MSQNLSESTAPASPQGLTAPAEPDSSSADLTPNDAGTDVDLSGKDAASGKDASIADLDAQLDANMLKARESDDEQPEPKSEPKPEEKIEAKPEAESEEEVDLLAEQTGPRKLEDFDKLFAPSQKSARQEMARLETALWEQKEIVNKIGGPVAIEIMQEVMPAILEANPGPIIVDGKQVKNLDGSVRTHGDVVFDGLCETNPALVLDMSKKLLFHSLEEEAPDPATGLPTNIATGNALIKTRWANHDVEAIDKLVALDDAGLIDHEELEKELALYKGDSEQVKALKQRLSAIEDKDKATQAAKETEIRDRKQQHYDRATGHVSKQVMDALIPLAEQFGWTATKEELNSDKPEVKQLAQAKIAMGEMLTAWMDKYVRNLPEYTAVEHLGKMEQAFTGDKPTPLFVRNSEPVINKTIAAFKQMVRVLNPTFAKSFGSTRAAKLKENTRSGAADTQIPPVKKVASPIEGDFNKAIAELDAGYDQAVRQRA